MQIADPQKATPDYHFFKSLWEEWWVINYSKAPQVTKLGMIVTYLPYPRNRRSGVSDESESGTGKTIKLRACEAGVCVNPRASIHEFQETKWLNEWTNER